MGGGGEAAGWQEHGEDDEKAEKREGFVFHGVSSRIDAMNRMHPRVVRLILAYVREMRRVIRGMKLQRSEPYHMVYPFQRVIRE